jgi:hypothetical protein
LLRAFSVKDNTEALQTPHQDPTEARPELESAFKKNAPADGLLGARCAGALSRRCVSTSYA